MDNTSTDDVTDKESNIDKYIVKRFEEMVLTNHELKQQLLEKEKIISKLSSVDTISSDYSNRIDSLTGLYNRSYLETIKDKFNEKQYHPLAVIAIDINGLKNINDTYGYEAGDKILIEMAKTLKSYCPEEGIICRVDGSEFFIVIPATDKSDAKVFCEKILKDCRDSKTEDIIGDLYISIAMAYYIRKDHSESFEIAFRSAETLMYRRKLLEPKSVRSSIVSSTMSTLEERYDIGQENIQRMIKLCRLTGQFLQFTTAMQDELELSCILHDIGKIAIRETIINKNAKLSKEEKKEMQTHPKIGYRITQSVKEFRHISENILYHHEKWDGTGYPDKLKGEEIPIISRIIAIVDAYDAMTTNRAYREALPEEYAINEIRNCAGTQFDPKIAQIFLRDVLQS